MKKQINDYLDDDNVIIRGHGRVLGRVVIIHLPFTPSSAGRGRGHCCGPGARGSKQVKSEKFPQLGFFEGRFLFGCFYSRPHAF